MKLEHIVIVIFVKQIKYFVWIILGGIVMIIQICCIIIMDINIFYGRMLIDYDYDYEQLMVMFNDFE
jgi:hypothetical protein